MFSSDWDMLPSLLDDDGRFFIDRDGSRFATILAHLRGDIVDIPDSSKERKALQAEATYYQVKHESTANPSCVVLLRVPNMSTAILKLVHECLCSRHVQLHAKCTDFRAKADSASP